MQFEVPWPLGPADGRYVLRGHAGRPDWVLVISTEGATRRHRRTKKVDAEPAPPEVPTGRATLISAEPLEGDPQSWLRSVDAGAEATEALAQVNRALHLFRIAAARPGAHGFGLDDTLAVRVGYGAGEQVAAGRWTAAVEPGQGPRRKRRRRMLQPDSRFASLLGGHDAALATEELALRARADADATRWREATLQLEAAFRVAPEELSPWRNHSDMASRIDELQQLAPGVEAAAQSARQGGVSEEQVGQVETALARLEAALRARSAAAVP